MCYNTHRCRNKAMSIIPKMKEADFEGKEQ